jgi:hypothetical protein
MDKAKGKSGKGNDGTYSPVRLPVFKGYTVGTRLREFRKVEYGKSIEVIPFNT